MTTPKSLNSPLMDQLTLLEAVALIETFPSEVVIANMGAEGVYAVFPTQIKNTRFGHQVAISDHDISDLYHRVRIATLGIRAAHRTNK